jgi:ribosomal protein S18 acetylase RimI-like enzyme
MITMDIMEAFLENSEFNIQHLPANEADTIFDLWVELHKELESVVTFKVSGPSTKKWGDVKTRYISRAQQGSFVIIAAFDKNKVPVGFCVCWVTGRGKIGEIVSLYTLPAYRNKGLGSTLMNNASDWLDSNGARAIRVTVDGGNLKAFQLYQQFGFIPEYTVMRNKKSKSVRL